jgi:hypothetical protein
VSSVKGSSTTVAEFSQAIGLSGVETAGRRFGEASGDRIGIG